MSTPTADELASVIHRICRDSVIDGTPGIHVVHKVGDLLAAQVRRAQWQDIATAPTGEAVPFLVLRRGVAIQASWFEGRLYPDAREACVDWEDGITDATHWQPLPSPPGPPSSQTDTGDST